MHKVASSRDLWPVHLKPKDDEFLSSWLARLSISHGLHTKTFCRIAFPEGFSDLRPSRKALNALAEKTGTSLEKVIATTLVTYEGSLFESITEYPQQWIMRTDIVRIYRRFGLQFCPQCLAEDDDPYFRHIWRLAFVVFCTKHHVLLLDRCSKCGEQINLQTRRSRVKRTGGVNSMTQCNTCLFDLRYASSNSNSPPIISQEIEYQEFLIKVLNRGWVEIPRYGPVYSLLYFPVFHKLMTLFSTDLKYADGCRVALSQHFGVPLFEISIPSAYAYLEWLNIDDRRKLVGMARLLLEDWPERLVDFGNACGISSFILFYGMKYIPFWYWKEVNDHFNMLEYERSDEEIESEKEYVDKQYRRDSDLRRAVQAQEDLHCLGTAYKRLMSRHRQRVLRRV